MKTDIDLIKVIDPSLIGIYTDALDFITVKPDFSLMNFRKMLEAVTLQLLRKFHLSFEKFKLHDALKALFNEKVIHETFNNNLHSLRVICNTAVHSREELNQDKDAFNRKIKIDAESARKLIVEIFEDTYLLFNAGAKPPKIELSPTGLQQEREILFNAVTSISSEAKFKAGLLYESYADNAIKSNSMLVDDDIYLHRQGLYEFAKINYKHACELSVIESYGKRLLSVDRAAFIESNCDIDALFRYAVLLSELEKDSNSGESLRLFKIAADRGHIVANVYFGANKYRDAVENKSFEEANLAKEYLDKVSGEEDALVYRFLFYYYKDGIGCNVNSELALSYIKKGADLDDKNCLAELGILYYKGEFVEKNKEKGVLLLEKARSRGCGIAMKFLFEQNLPLIGKAISDRFERLVNINKIETFSKKKIVGVNQPCPCGSKKKYKKCHGF